MDEKIAVSMADILPLAESRAIEDLLCDHWERIDRITEGLIDDLYTADGEMRIGSLYLAGRSAIHSYATERRASEDQSGRRTRHIMSNLRVQQNGESGATVRFIMTVYAGRGEPPFRSTPPSNVVDFGASCRKLEDGSWRIASLRGSAVFVGDEAPANVR